MNRTILMISILLTACAVTANDANAAEKGPADRKKKPTAKTEIKIDESLPMVLIIGDSISIGYTPMVKKYLEGKANVIHNPGNSQGTTHTVANLSKWLAQHRWDVIHFNLGLHDLKRVKQAGTTQNSDNPDDPRQADLATYTASMEKIVKELKSTGAKLIFATTTPFPAGVKPHRDPEDAVRYNEAAVGIMKANGIEVNDLYTLVLPELEKLQQPVNVHFKPEGSDRMARQVADVIIKALNTR